MRHMTQIHPLILTFGEYEMKNKIFIVSKISSGKMQVLISKRGDEYTERRAEITGKQLAMQLQSTRHVVKLWKEREG